MRLRGFLKSIRWFGFDNMGGNQIIKEYQFLSLTRFVSFVSFVFSLSVAAVATVATVKTVFYLSVFRTGQA